MAESNIEESDPTHFPSFSRCSSTGSLHTITSSANNTTDDEDSDMGAHMKDLKDRRREAHTQAEQKRRDAIKKGYDCLQELVPMCQNSDSSQTYKLSKATVLQKSVDYIHYLQNCRNKQEEEVAALNKEVFAMTIMKFNYDQIVSAHQSQPGNHSRQVSDDVKFEVFRAVIDSLFQTFDLSVTTNSFAEISGSVIQWVEEHCKPQILREVMCGILTQLQQHEYATSSSSHPNVVINPQSSSGAHIEAGHGMGVSTTCGMTPVLYTSPGSGSVSNLNSSACCNIPLVRTMPGSYMN